MQDALKDIFGPMFEAMLQGKMNNHLGYDSNDHGIKTTDNRRNGYTNKKVKTSAGEVDIKVPRDRDSSSFSITAMPFVRLCIQPMRLKA